MAGGNGDDEIHGIHRSFFLCRAASATQAQPATARPSHRNATAKHFPGLGAATVNTDLEPSTVELTAAQLERGLVPFRAAVDALVHGYGAAIQADGTGHDL